MLIAAETGPGAELLLEPLAADAIADGRLSYVPGRAEPNPADHFIRLRTGEQRDVVIVLASRLLAATL